MNRVLEIREPTSFFFGLKHRKFFRDFQTFFLAWGFAGGKERIRMDRPLKKNCGTTLNEMKVFNQLNFNFAYGESVGYRVNSKRCTRSRIWANRLLKEHLVQGYTINQKRLIAQQNQITRLRESIQLVERSLLEQVETIDDDRKVVKVLSEFA